MKKVLFVCTGNIFRSMSAEYILRASLPKNSGIIVSSAGTRAAPEPEHMVHSILHERLRESGLDVSRHKQTKVNADLLAQQDLVIAMNTDHKDYLLDTFAYPSYLFYEASYDESKSFPDLPEVVADYETNIDAARTYIHKVVGMIQEAMPNLIARLPLLWE